MQVAILCGGLGTRLRADAQSLPKPLVEIGGHPILWHVMQGYARCGFTDFLLCLGFGREAIEAYVRRPGAVPASWHIECVDTGLDTNTGGRLKRLESRLRDATFCATYADGVANLDIRTLVAFHAQHGRIGTVTLVNPPSQFGEVVVGEDERVTAFQEKPRLPRWINGGFFVFQREIFRYLDDQAVLEREPLEALVRDRQLCGFTHTGFWCCMDTYKDTLALNELCRSGTPPWMTEGS